MDNQRYHYDRIKDPSNQIRLVKILSRQGRKRISLKLEITSIDEVKGQYEAVSYMWGPQSPERHVIIDGKVLRLRDNIWRCLKHLRDHGLTRSKLWIDTISINQSDNHEKSQQVAKMRQIFKNASRVLIWLGSTSLQTYLHSPGSDTLQESIENLPLEDQDSWIDVLGHSDPRSLSLENQIMSIVYNSYWRRLWIVQEVALARETCIVFGKALLGNDYISPIYFTARENSKPGYRSWIARQQDPSIRNVGTALLDHHPMLHACHKKGKTQEIVRRDSLSELIRTYHWQDCTNPRDYVFGLVGLLDPGIPFEIDYTASNEEVAVRAMQYLDKEASQDSENTLGLDWSAIAALLKALTVTSSTYLRGVQTLPIERANALQGMNFGLCFKPMIVLPINDSVREPENKAYEDVYQINVSGNLTKYLYRMKPQDFISIKLLDGQIKQYTHMGTWNKDTRDSIELGKNSGVAVLCFLHSLPAIIIRPSSDNDSVIEVQHFVSGDVTRPPHEESPMLEMRLPKVVQVALHREINTCDIDWNDPCQVASSSSFLHFSALEMVSLCELIAPRAAEQAEFWKNN